MLIRPSRLVIFLALAGERPPEVCTRNISPRSQQIAPSELEQLDRKCRSPCSEPSGARPLQAPHHPSSASLRLAGIHPSNTRSHVQEPPSLARPSDRYDGAVKSSWHSIQHFPLHLELQTSDRKTIPWALSSASPSADPQEKWDEKSTVSQSETVILPSSRRERCDPAHCAPGLCFDITASGSSSQSMRLGRECVFSIADFRYFSGISQPAQLAS